MKLSTFLRSSVMTFIFVLTLFIGIQAQTTAFTYQGRLTDASMPAANGTYDFEFALFSADSSGTQISTIQSISGVTVNKGVFNIQLDFGAASFSGADRYLEIRVKKPADASYTTLSPRQRITGTPYSIRSLNAGTAETATNATNAANANNADKLDNIDSSSFVQTNTTAFIRNQTTQLESAGFNISGTGKANVFDATLLYNIRGRRVLGTEGVYNLYVGFNAGFSNTGGFNSFIGTDAGYGNTTGSHNSFVGAAAGFFNKTGFGNSFVGVSAGETNSTGSNNVFLGAHSGVFNTVGDNNSYLGNETGTSNRTGSNNTMIGYKANVSADNLTFSTAIGAEAVVGTSNTIALGRNDGSDKVVIYGLGAAGTPQATLCRNTSNQIAFCSSSRRYKTDIEPYKVGLNLINQLKPVSFNWKITNQADIGLIAEEVAEVEPRLAYKNQNGEIEGVSYSQMSVVLINAVKEQQEQIQVQQNQIEEQKTINQNLQSEVRQQKQQNKAQQQQIDALTKLICSQNTKADVCKQEK
jgi:hypothetical protein